MAVTLGAGTDQVDYGDTTLFDGATALTVAITYKPSALDKRLLSKWGNLGSEEVLLIDTGFTGSSDEIGILVGEGVSYATRFGYQTTDMNMVVGTTYRIVFTWSPGSMNIYSNGSEPSKTSWLSGTVNSIGNASTALQLGYNSDEAVNAALGDYSEFAIWTRKLSADEALAVSNGVSPACTPRDLVIYDKLINTSSRDIFGGISPTHTSTDNAAHPSVIYPSAQILQFPPAAAAASLPTVNGVSTYTSFNGVSSFTSINGVS